jgi:tRNA threonylcarbamoyladenosine biosynthesis protein TsaE
MGTEERMEITIELESSSPLRTQELGAALAACLERGDVVGLVGELGAGKTCFVRGMAQGLGLDAGAVSSPTFVIRHEYLAPSRESLVHIDAYRLRGAEDLESIGWSELLAQRSAIVVVEWADRIAAELPAQRTVTVEIEHAGLDCRTLALRGPRRVVAAMRARLQQEPPLRPTCPICGRALDAGAETFPFCSRRCRGADLGRWLGGRYVISRKARAEDVEDVEGAGEEP